VSHQFQQRRHREIGRAHEDQTERHEVIISCDRLIYSSWPGLSHGCPVHVEPQFSVI
jgi:hypothetical protein